MDEDKIKALIIQEATRIATEVYRTQGTQYGVARVPQHIHNGVDSTQIPPTSITSFKPLDSTGLGSSPTTSGVLAVAYASGQAVNDENGNFVRSAQLYVDPVPIIFGNGVGAASQFNGGEAPEGTILIFSNPMVAEQLWWRTHGEWWGVDVTGGYGNPANAVGPA